MDDPSACLMLAACICGKDGVISDLEERALLKRFQDRFPDFSAEEFEKVLTEFFDSTDQIEDYLLYVNDPELRRFTLEAAKESASSDGLDIRENIALEKAYLMWGEKNNA